MLNDFSNYGDKNSIPGFDKRFKYSFYKFKAINLSHTVVRSPIYISTNPRVKKFTNFVPHPLNYQGLVPI